MRTLFKDFDKASRAIESAAKAVIKKLVNEDVVDEDQFTDQWIGQIEAKLESLKSPKLKWKASRSRGHGTGANERPYGADFAGILTINAGKYHVHKGFLAQAKLIKKEGSTPKRKDLVDQCERMLDITSDSFVFIYTPNGVFIIPALSIVSGSQAFPWNIDTTSPGYSYKTVKPFFLEHFQSFIGDRNITTFPPTRVIKVVPVAHVRTDFKVISLEDSVPDIIHIEATTE